MIGIDEKYDQIGRELRQHLPASPARGMTARRRDCHCREFPHPFRDGSENGRALRAGGKSIGGVFDVDSGDYVARRSKQRGSNSKLRVRRIRISASVESRLN